MCILFAEVNKMEEKLTDQELARRAKLEKYHELGVDPYGQKFERTDTAKSIHEKCDALNDEELEAKQEKEEQKAE